MTVRPQPQPQPWPAPDPMRGMALNIRQVADRLGLRTVAAVDVALLRSRRNTKIRILFPEPDGTALPPGRTYAVRFWWEATIETYRQARQRAGGGRRKLTDHDIKRIRRMRTGGRGMAEIATATGWSVATVSRIVNHKAHTPKGSS